MDNKDNYSPNEVADFSRVYSGLVNATNLFEEALTTRRRRSFEVMSDKVIYFARQAAANFHVHHFAFQRVPENVKAELTKEDKETMERIQRLERVFNEHYK